MTFNPEFDQSKSVAELLSTTKELLQGFKKPVGKDERAGGFYPDVCRSLVNFIVPPGFVFKDDMTWTDCYDPPFFPYASTTNVIVVHGHGAGKPCRYQRTLCFMSGWKPTGNEERQFLQEFWAKWERFREELTGEKATPMVENPTTFDFNLGLE